ncbi:amino acid ABC transporter permease [Carbonactinospora thermoautotrophica]|uniref:Amino acid ABC transporter permease n=1 Tax=Carbonactinospora thermoautotrophica TaxID=1469144 RepID=A0A132MPN2_9ACTN|nr:amino acid ABC transporter permease [Carbonactinospora thermoautotrophica]KWW99753.1 Polar amino acid ABC transporter [Carbonactinospora thermoautotrophica]KWX04489.1 amino acid ABC transporter permease [Carbonactinospora thermoautotrophica]KWX08978.1 amino acid ABC transporter permease [Carbonactinospora thermoautotrophica]
MSTSVLFDVPGPAGRRRNRLIGLASVVILTALAGYVIYRFAVTGQFSAQKWAIFQYVAIQQLLLNGLINTLKAAALATVLALVFGAVFAAGRLSDHAWVRGPAGLVVELFRAIPLLILIFLFYYGSRPLFGIALSPLWALVFGLTLYNGSVLAEVFRAGVLAVPRGQSEAAYALGLRKTQVMTLILLPQALRSMLPSIVSQLVVLLKDTALGFIITYEELLFVAKQLGTQVQFGSPFIPAAIVVAVIYVGICMALSWFAGYLARHRPRKSAAPPTRPEELETSGAVAA